MGSKLRRLRAKAGVTGHAHQKRQREAARRKERARKVRLEFQDGNVIVGVNSKGGQLRSSEQLRDALAALPAALPGSSELAFHRIRLEEQRIQLAQLLGSHDGAEELADAITIAARSGVDSAAEVWERTLAELRSGVPATELSVLRKPEQPKVYEAESIELKVGGEVVPQVPEPPKKDWHIHRPGQRSRLFSVLAMAMIGGIAVPPRRDR